MLSINSLVENLLPNIYVKGIDLQTQFASQMADPKAPKYQGAGFHSDETNGQQKKTIESPLKLSESNIMLSVKNLKTSTYSQEIIDFINSEFSDNIKIYAHQITDRFLYENILQSLTAGENLNSVTSVQDLELPEEAEFKSINNLLTRNDSQDYLDGLKTQMLSFLDIPLWNKFNNNSNPSTVPITEQILGDGTILNEGIINLKFSFNKDTSFLAYLFIVSVETTSEFSTGKITSKPTAEVILIDGKFQNTGVIFTISADQGGVSLDELTNFGKVGDIWAGGVHVRNGRYMAGTTHTNNPHAFLDYQFVEVSKYTDNRVIDRASRTPFNVSGELNTVEASVSVFKNNLKLSKFSEYKKKNYLGDIFLSQDQEMNVNGLFFIDKYETIKNNCAFPFIFKNINLAFDEKGGSSLAKNVLIGNLMAGSELLSLKVYGPFYNTSYSIEDELLVTMNQDTINNQVGLSLEKPATDPNNKVSDKQFVIKKISQFGLELNESELDSFMFKHHIGKNQTDGSKLKYRYVVQYKDPTIIAMKSVINQIKAAKKDTETFVKYIDTISGFDQYSQKIKDNVLKNILPENFNWVSSAGKPFYIKRVSSLAKSPLAYVAFYNPNTKNKNSSQNEFTKQLLNLCRFDTITLDKVNVLLKFLSNLQSTMQLALSSVSSQKQIKNSTGTANQYDQNNNVLKFAGSDKGIRQESKSFHITISDHGYDFTGDFVRNKNQFYSISRSEFVNKCNTLFSTQFTTLSNDDQFTQEEIEAALDLSYKPKGFTARSPRENLYSFLNIPIQKDKLKKCVMLPKTIINKDLDTVNLQHIFLSVVKNKKQILQNNSKMGLSETQMISQDLLSILGSEGGGKGYFTTPSDKSSQAASETSNVSLVQKDFSFATSQDLGTLNETSITSIAASELKNNEFKVSPPKTVKLTDDLPNYVLLSVLYRKLFTNTSSQTSFKLKISEEDFQPYETFEELAEVASTPLPLNTLCLSIDGENFGSLKNFISDDQTYIKNGVVDPALLSYFWFIHQNIVFVEYLENFEVQQQTSMLKVNSGSDIDDIGDIITTKTRDIKKPVFKPITDSLLNSKNIGDKLICRLRQYENSTYINKKLLTELKMPLINNYFMLEVQ